MLRIRAVREQREDTLIAISGQSVEIEQLSIDRCRIDFEVPGMDDCARRSLDSEGIGIHNRVRHVEKLDGETTDVNRLFRGDRVKLRFSDNPMLLEFASHQSHGESGPVNRYVQVRNDKRQRADMIFMAM